MQNLSADLTINGANLSRQEHGRDCSRIDAGSFECPHCHESHHYSTDDYIPGEGRIVIEWSTATILSLSIIVTGCL